MNESQNQRPPDVVPDGLSRSGETGIEISWSDGSRSSWTVSELRKACPCASCRQERNSPDESTDAAPALPVLSAAEAQPLRIEAMQPVGSYAYGITFSDGHSSGIFTFDLLYRTD